MADYEEHDPAITELEEQLNDSIDGYVDVHDDPDQDEATRHAALHHHSKTIAYTAQEILTIDPDHAQAQKLLAMFALSLNGQFQPHHYRDLGLEDEGSEYEGLDHHPWKPEYLPHDEDHSHLLDTAPLPNEPHHHHNGEDEAGGQGDEGKWNEELDGNEEDEAEMPQEEEGGEDAEGYYDHDDDGQYGGDEGWHSGDEHSHEHSEQHNHEY